MRVRLTHIDGKLPNIALMKLSAFHQQRGDEVHFTKSVWRDMLEPKYDRVYGSAIFSQSIAKADILREQFPGAIIGGTHDASNQQTVEQFTGAESLPLDYSIYPRFEASMGFTQRGCRLKCGFCVVPRKEGANRSEATIEEIWRGAPWPKHLHLLDNDFFGQPREQWTARHREIIDGGFRVCLNQGINVRLLDDEAAEALAAMPYYDDSFKVRRLYTAWDNIGDEARFFTGVDRLERAGVPATHIMAYMLVGYDKRETWSRVLYRFTKMVERGIRPYPMIYGDRERSLPVGDAPAYCARRTLKDFQRWVIRKSYNFVDFADYDAKARGHMPKGQMHLWEVAA